jgi:hypothetical protein
MIAGLENLPAERVFKRINQKLSYLSPCFYLNYFLEKVYKPMEQISRESVAQQISLSFFNQEVNIQSDSSTYINLFKQMYSRFVTHEQSSVAQPSLDVSVWTKTDNSHGRPVIVMDGEVRPLNDPGLMEGYVYECILSTVTERISSHFLFHAGAVSCNGQGIIFPADESHGKTTLVLELVKRGFRFLSDEMAALGREDRQVYPFPRSLRIKPGTLELTGFPDAAAKSEKWLDKLILDIEKIKPNSMGEPIPLNHVVILQNTDYEGEMSAGNTEKKIMVTLDRLEETFLSAVRKLEGVIKINIFNGRYPALQIHTVRTTPLLSSLEELCRENQILIMNIAKVRGKCPDFKSAARLVPISRSQAAMEMIKRFQGGNKSRLLQDEFSGNHGLLFLELAAIISQADCYKLYVGSLNEMADLVCNLVRHPCSGGR